MQQFLVFFYLINSYAVNTCLTYKKISNASKSVCINYDYIEQTDDKISLKTCLHCMIEDVSINIANRCRHRAKCVSFMFDNNTFSEEFFHQNPTVVESLLKKRDNDQMVLILQITFNRYNLAEISPDYFHSILHLNFTSFNMLNVTFINPMATVKSINLNPSLIHVPNCSIHLKFSCNHALNWIECSIKSNQIVWTKSNVCPLLSVLHFARIAVLDNDLSVFPTEC